MIIKILVRKNDGTVIGQVETVIIGNGIVNFSSDSLQEVLRGDEKGEITVHVMDVKK